MDAPNSVPSQFVKTLGPMGVIMLTFSALSPVTSVYVAGAGVLRLAGTGAAIAFILGGLVSAMLALLYAELGAAFPRAGGVYPPIAGALGSAAAFPLLVVTMMIQPAFIAFIAIGLAVYARVLVPALPLIPLAVGSVVFATAISLATIKTNAFVTGVFLAVEGLALLLLAGVAVTHSVRGLGVLLTHPMVLDGGTMKPASFGVLALATVSGAWSCAGASWAMYFGEEMKDAREKIGRVIAWSGLCASLAIAGPMVLMLLSARDIPGMLAAEAPVAFYLGHTGGDLVANLVSLGVLAAIFNNLIAATLGISRQFYATGRDGVWPRAVNRVLTTLHPNLKSPVTATLILGAVASLVCFAPPRLLIVLLAGDVFPSLLISLAVFFGRRRGLTGARYRAPLFPLVPIVGFVVALSFVVATYLDVESGRPSMILLVAVFAASLGFNLYRRRKGYGWVLPNLSEPDHGVSF